MKSPNKNNNLFTPLFVFISLLSISLLSACGGGGSDPVVNESPSGLYTNGTGKLNGIDASDITAIVNESHIMIFSMTAKVLIDGTISTITGNEYSANVNIYTNGLLSQPNVSVTGLVTNASQISGTLNGTGAGSGNYSIVFSLEYNNSAVMTNIVADNLSTWKGLIVSEMEDFDGTDTDSFEFTAAGVFTGEVTNDGATAPASNGWCRYTGTVSITNPNINIYSFQQFADTPNHSNCTLSSDDDFSGYLSMVNNQLVYVVANGTNSLFGVLTK